MIRAVLDANVYVSAAVRPEGPPGQIIERFLRGDAFEIVMSQAIVEAARPQITALVAAVVDAPLDGRFTVDQMRIWRESMTVRAARDAGFAYEGYVRLKLASVRAYISQLENGHKSPTLDLLFRLADPLKVRASELIARVEQQENPSD